MISWSEEGILKFPLVQVSGEPSLTGACQGISQRLILSQVWSFTSGHNFGSSPPSHSHRWINNCIGSHTTDALQQFSSSSSCCLQMSKLSYFQAAHKTWHSSEAYHFPLLRYTTAPIYLPAVWRHLVHAHHGGQMSLSHLCWSKLHSAYSSGLQTRHSPRSAMIVMIRVARYITSAIFTGVFLKGNWFEGNVNGLEVLLLKRVKKVCYYRSFACIKAILWLNGH